MPPTVTCEEVCGKLYFGRITFVVLVLILLDRFSFILIYLNKIIIDARRQALNINKFNLKF